MVIKLLAVVIGDQIIKTMGSSYWRQSGVSGDWTVNIGGGMVCLVIRLPTLVVAWLEWLLSYWTYNTDHGVVALVTRWLAMVAGMKALVIEPSALITRVAALAT